MLNPTEQKHLNWAKSVSAEYRKREHELVDILAKSEKLKLHRKLGYASMFKFATEELKLSEAISLALIRIARTSQIVPQIRNLPISKANRIASIITEKNAVELIQFANQHTVRQIEAEVAKRNPKKAGRDRAKYLSEEYVEITVTMTKASLVKLKRAEAIKASDWGTIIENALTEYLHRHDPVAKAERNQGKEPRARKPFNGRKPLAAHVVHQVNLRDQAKCTFVGADGRRCNEERWTEKHHIIPLSLGGTDDPANLTTLCSFHHSTLHVQSSGLRWADRGGARPDRP